MIWTVQAAGAAGPAGPIGVRLRTVVGGNGGHVTYKMGGRRNLT